VEETEMDERKANRAYKESTGDDVDPMIVANKVPMTAAPAVRASTARELSPVKTAPSANTIDFKIFNTSNTPVTGLGGGPGVRPRVPPPFRRRWYFSRNFRNSRPLIRQPIIASRDMGAMLFMA